MATPTLKLNGVSIQRAAAAAAPSDKATAAPPPLQLSLAVENPGSQPLHVWASWRAYEYDAATHVLTVYLTDHTPTPPGITLISKHPRTPAQVTVTPKGKLNIKVAIPSTIRRRTTGPGMGLHFVEEPIGQVDRVEFHVQFGTEALATIPHETPDQHRSRMLAQGDVVRATIPTTAQKE